MMMEKKTVVFQPGSRTFRQMPDNYLLAFRMGYHNEWVCNPDLAADKDICAAVFKVINASFDNKYGNGDELLVKINEELAHNVRSICVDSRAVELEYGRGCHCEDVSDEVGRTLDEIAEIGGPNCPRCQTEFRLTSVCVLVENGK